MRRGTIHIMILALALTLGACAQPPINKDGGVSVIDYPDGTKEVNYGPGEFQNGNMQANIEACQQWAQDEQIKKFEQMSTIPESHKSFVLMHGETMAMVKEVFGKGADPCKPGTNQWDAYIAYVQEHSKEVDSITRGVVKVGTVGIITLGAVEITDTIIGGVGATIAGDQINAGNNANKAGRDIDQTAMDGSLSTSATESHITQTQVGSDESNIEPAQISNTSGSGEAVESGVEEGVEIGAEAATTSTTQTSQAGSAAQPIADGGTLNNPNRQ